MERRRSLEAPADFEAAFNVVGVTPKEEIAEPKGQGNKDVFETRDLSVVGEGGQSDELRKTMQSLQKDNAALHAACATEKAACAKSLDKTSTLWAEKGAQKKRIDKLTRRLEEELSARERSVAEWRHTKGAVAVKEKLVEQVKQILALVTEQEGEAVKGKETMTELNIKSKAAGKREEDDAYERDGQQARLQQSQRVHEKVG